MLPSAKKPSLISVVPTGACQSLRPHSWALRCPSAIPQKNKVHPFLTCLPEQNEQPWEMASLTAAQADLSQAMSPPYWNHKFSHLACVSPRLHLTGVINPPSSHIPKPLTSLIANQKAVPPSLCVHSPSPNNRTCMFIPADTQAPLVCVTRCCL